VEPELFAAQQAFGDAQRMLGEQAGALSKLLTSVDIRWHEFTESDWARGCLALASADSDYEDLVGSILRVTSGHRSVLVYCVASVVIEHDLSLTRRAWMALGDLASTTLTARVEVLDG
jgi:hypothetical protein